MIRTKRYEKMSFTPALPLAVKGWNALIEAGMCANNFLLQWDHSAIVAFLDDDAHAFLDDNVPMGVLVWSKIEWQKEIFIHLGYVLPEYRRSGVYTALWEELIVKAREDKMHHIAGATSLKNTALRKTAVKQGRKELNVHLWYEIESE